MRITTRGCYGLRAMLELALHHGDKPVLMRDIAESQAVSRKYLHALLTSLKTAGLVRAVRGASGGYVLARDPVAIRICEILQALEGTLSLTDCVQDPSVCERSSHCVGHELWTELSHVVTCFLGELTLADLAARFAKKNSRHAPVTEESQHA